MSVLFLMMLRRTFIPKVVNVLMMNGRSSDLLLTPDVFPSFFGKESDFMSGAARDHSSGNCPGFTPGSLLSPYGHHLSAAKI